MEQLIEAFGIDVRLITIQIINFGILVGLLTYFLYKPVLKVLNDREEKIAQGIKDAEDAAKSKSLADEKKKEILAAAHKDAEEVAVKAKVFADEKSDEIVAQAQTKAEDVIRDAQIKGENIKKQAQKESEAEIAKLAILAAEKVLREKNS